MSSPISSCLPQKIRGHRLDLSRHVQGPRPNPLYDPDKLLLCSHSAKWSNEQATGVEYMTEWPHQEPMLRLSLN